LRYHLPANRRIPVLTSPQVGHIWPMTPLPVHFPATIGHSEDGRHTIRWLGPALKVI